MSIQQNYHLLLAHPQQILLLLQDFTIKTIGTAIFFFIGWYATNKILSYINRTLEHKNVEKGIVSFTHSVMNPLLKSILIIISMSLFGLNISSIVATLGAIFVTIGLALKDNLSNIASGALIIINKPFKVGDELELDGYSGTVLKIEIMFTTMATSDEGEIIVPNSKLTSTIMRKRITQGGKHTT